VVRVRENEVLQILRMMAQRSYRVKDLGLVTRVSGIDQGELTIAALEDHAVGTSERHQPRPLDDLLHRRSPSLGSSGCRFGEKAVEARRAVLTEVLAYTVKPYRC
jgi:hypothetical protein